MIRNVTFENMLLNMGFVDSKEVEKLVFDRESTEPGVADCAQEFWAVVFLVGGTEAYIIKKMRPYSVQDEEEPTEVFYGWMGGSDDGTYANAYRPDRPWEKEQVHLFKAVP